MVYTCVLGIVEPSPKEHTWGGGVETCRLQCWGGGGVGGVGGGNHAVFVQVGVGVCASTKRNSMLSRLRASQCHGGCHVWPELSASMRIGGQR